MQIIVNLLFNLRQIDRFDDIDRHTDRYIDIDRLSNRHIDRQTDRFGDRKIDKPDTQVNKR